MGENVVIKNKNYKSNITEWKMFILGTGGREEQTTRIYKIYFCIWTWSEKEPE
jgi:hypothetical protein